MKRVLAMILSSMVAVSMIPTLAFAAEADVDESSGGQVQTESVSDDEDDYYENATDIEYGNWTFDIVAGKAVITAYNNDFSGGTFHFPSAFKYKWGDGTVVTYEVTGIVFPDDGASIDLSACTELSIPASVTSIGEYTFTDYDHEDKDNTDLVVNCACGSAAEKWALANRYNTTNGVTRSIIKATFDKNGSLTSTCNECGASGTWVIRKAGNPFMLGGLKDCFGYTFYTGKNIKPQASCECEYTLSGPSTVKNIGTYKYTITLKGWYSGTKKLSLTVVPKSTTIKKLSKGKKSFTVKWKKQTSQTTGYQIRYSTSKSMKKAKTVTVKGNKKTSKKIKKLKKKKTYYVQVRTYKTVKGKKYAIPWGEFSKKVKTK